MDDLSHYTCGSVCIEYISDKYFTIYNCKHHSVLQNLLECNSSQDVYLNFQNGGNRACAARLLRENSPNGHSRQVKTTRVD